MRIEIAEQLAVCALSACEDLTVTIEGKKYQCDGMYAKVASFGSSLTSLGLIPTAMRFEDDRNNTSANEEKKAGNYLVNDAIFKTLASFTNCKGVKELWKPDERLRDLMKKHNTLVKLYCDLDNAADYYLVIEYSMLACASLKLALNTYPDFEKSKTAKGSDEHDG